LLTAYEPAKLVFVNSHRDPEPIDITRSNPRTSTHPASASGKKAGIALALGGGFSRGFAHLGVLEILEQEHIPISIIVGTSIGALLGAAYSDGISIDELCRLGSQVSLRDLIRFQNSGDRKPSPKAHKHDLIGRFVREFFHAKRIEELSIPMAIVTTNLDTGAPHVFTLGSLELAIRASCAFPGLFQPVEHDGMMLADGCIVAPVPTAFAARMNGGCVLGVDVSSNPSSEASAETIARSRDRTGWRPHGGVAEPSWSRDADIILEPAVHHIEWNDFSRAEEARAAGAEAMRRALPHVRELLARQNRLTMPEQTSGVAQRELAL
jgi:NTE family protein